MMTITRNKVVTFDFTLKDDKGTLLDSSTANEPVEYIHGYGQIMQGVEDNLEGKESGDALDFTVEPKAGYGEYDEKLLISVPKDKIEGEGAIELGTPITVRVKGGERVFTIARIDENDVVLDGNHPLAGMQLHFGINVRDVREATPDELEHMHQHAEGGGCCSCEECGSDCGDNGE